MGLYPISCPTCGGAHMWFSGNLDQRCPTCQKAGKTERLSQAELDKIRHDQLVKEGGYTQFIDYNPNIPRVRPKGLKPNHLRISNLTELEYNGDQCKVIRVEMDGYGVASLEPGESFDINLPHGSTLNVRESTTQYHTKGQMETKDGITSARFTVEPRE